MARVIPFVLVLALAACSKAPQQASAPGSPAPGATATPPPASALPEGAAPAKPVAAELPAVIAKVNGDTITKADFEKAVRNIESRAGGPVPASERDRVFRRVLEELIGYRLLVQESQQRKVAVADADIDARLKTIRQQFPTEEAFKSTLQQQHLTMDQVRAETRQEISVSKLIEAEVAPKVTVKPEEIEAFYQQNPQSFQVPEQVRASHILITVAADADAKTRAAARAKAATVLKSARAGKDFAALAKEYSQDPGSAASGGDLGTFRPGQMVGPFNDVAFKLPPGTISDVVETEFGYHIIKVTEKQPARSVTLDEARADIERHLQTVNRQRETQAFVQALRTKGKVEIFI